MERAYGLVFYDGTGGGERRQNGLGTEVRQAVVGLTPLRGQGTAGFSVRVCTAVGGE
jgi:hypothetical protein